MVLPHCPAWAVLAKSRWTWLFASTISRSPSVRVLATCWLVLEFASSAAAQGAREIVVTTLEDRVDASDRVTSLREAILEARASGGNHRIRLPAGVYSLSAETSAKGGATEAADVWGTPPDRKRMGRLTMVGAGSAQTVLDATQAGRFFSVGHGEILNLQGVKMIGGVAPLNPNGQGFGGAIFSEGGTVTLTDCELIDNYALHSGGAIHSFEYTGPDGTRVSAHVTLRNCVVSGNSSVDGAGIFSNGQGCTVTAMGTTFSTNEAERKGAGILFLGDGELELTDCSFVENKSVSHGGAAFETDYGDEEATVIATDCDFFDNSATGFGGAINILRGSACTLSGCNFSGNRAGVAGAFSAHVFNEVEIANCLFDDNHASGDVGAIVAADVPTFTMSGCDVLANSSGRFSGAISATRCESTITNCTISNNQGRNSAGDAGGGVSNIQGTMSIGQSTFSHNIGGFTGGAISNEGNSVIEGVLSLHNCQITGNHAPSGGGAIINASHGRMTIANCTISGNTTNGGGGGIQNAFGIEIVVNNSTVSDNSGFWAGGIDNTAGSVIRLDDCIISNNTSTGTPSSLFPGAGGINNNRNSTVEITRCSIRGNRANFQGGGFRNEGELTILDSTISGNSAEREGGGIFNWREGQVEVVNSTISGNVALLGGGLLNLDVGGRIRCAHSTITGNRVDPNDIGGGLGGGLRLFNGTAELRNTILAGNYRGSGAALDDITNNNRDVDASSAYNLIGDPGSSGGLEHGVFGNIVGNGIGGPVNIASVLETILSGNGGRTATHLLVADSPALDAGDPNFTTTELLYDQRGVGFPRILNSRIDIGAVETEPQSSCLVESATRSMGISLPLGTLRAFRDEVLSSTQDGLRLRTLYYAHGPELKQIFWQHPRLAMRSLEAVASALPAIQASRSHHVVRLDRGLYAQIRALLTECASHASPELSVAIDEVQGLLSNRTVLEGSRAVIDLRDSGAANPKGPAGRLASLQF